jgi:hypothetical protein
MGDAMALDLRLAACFSVVLLAGCEHWASPPPSADPAAANAGAHGDPAVSPQGRSRCQTIAGHIADLCHDSATPHSAKIERWCTRVVTHSTRQDTRWIDDCAAREKYMDGECFTNATTVQNAKQCDDLVSR